MNWDHVQLERELHPLHRDQDLWLPWNHLTRSGGAHAIALRHNPSGRMQVFDSNYGHFVVRDHTLLKRFLRRFLKQTGYGKRHDSRHGVVGVRPLIGVAK